MGTAFRAVETNMVRVAAPPVGSARAKALQRAAPLADKKLPWIAASAALLLRRRWGVVPALALACMTVAVSASASRGIEHVVGREPPKPEELGDRVQTGDEPSSSSMP